MKLHLRNRGKTLAQGVLGLVLAAVLTLGPPAFSLGSAAAHTPEDKIQELEQKIQASQQNLSALKEEMEKQKNALEQAEQREQTVIQEIQSLNQALNQTRERLAVLESDLKIMEQRVSEAEDELADAERRLDKRIELVQSRVRLMYERGQVSYLSVLLGSDDFTDFISRFTNLRDWMSSDVELLEAVKEERAAVEAKRDRLEEQRQTLASLYEQTAELERQREIQVAERQSARKRLEANQAAYRQALEEMERDSERITALIQEYQREQARLQLSAGNFDGTMIWPVRGGWISSEFGRRFHPVLQEWRGHDGLDIAVSWGTPVKAAAPGQVIYSGWYGGYGNTVIIDHGNGISTLYGHNSSLSVSNGSKVQAGQQVSKVGSTGLSTGPHLHFEVRDDGVPVNPRKYLSPR